MSSNPPARAQPSTAAIIGFRGGVWVIPHSPRPCEGGRLAPQERLEVHPGREYPARAGEDADPKLGVRVELVHCVPESGGHAEVECVLRLRAVDRDHQHAAAPLEDNFVLFHRPDPRSSFPPSSLRPPVTDAIDPTRAATLVDITGARKPWLAQTWATRCANGTAARTETEEREELFAALT